MAGTQDPIPDTRWSTVDILDANEYSGMNIHEWTVDGADAILKMMGENEF